MRKTVTVDVVDEHGRGIRLEKEGDRVKITTLKVRTGKPKLADLKSAVEELERA